MSPRCLLWGNAGTIRSFPSPCTVSANRPHRFPSGSGQLQNRGLTADQGTVGKSAQFLETALMTFDHPVIGACVLSRARTR
jgi:hypothetical protein